MKGFLRATFNRQKFQGLFINTALGNFAAYLAGSLVTLVSTHQAIQRRANRNLFGILPRKKIVVHVVPHWLEWLLALIVGFLVMEAVRYCFNHRVYAALLSALRPKRRADTGRPPTLIGQAVDPVFMETYPSAAVRPPCSTVKSGPLI